MAFTDVLLSRWPVFLSLFLQKTVLSSWLIPGLIFMNWPRPCGFTPGLSLLSWSPCVCVPASSSLWWLLQGRAVVWSRRGRYLQQWSSFSESSWPFKVLFNISSLLVGVFLFLWKGHWISFCDGSQCICWWLCLKWAFEFLLFQCLSVVSFSVYLCFLWFLYQCFLVFWLLVFYVLD